MSELTLKDKKKLLGIYKKCSKSILRDWEWKPIEDITKVKKVSIRNPFLRDKKKIDAKIISLMKTMGVKK